MAALLLQVPTTPYSPQRQQQQQDMQQQQDLGAAKTPFYGVLQQQEACGVYIQPAAAAIESAAAPVLLRELQRLRGRAWLNDSVINAFLKLLQTSNNSKHMQGPTT